MSEIEKINREFAMIENDLRLARESLLLRIIRNKRQPIAARYAALMHHSQLFNLPDHISDERMESEIKLFILNRDRRAL